MPGEDPGYIPIRRATPRVLGIGFLVGVALMSLILYLGGEAPCTVCEGAGDLRRKDQRPGYAGTTAGVPCRRCDGMGSRMRFWDLLGERER